MRSLILIVVGWYLILIVGHYFDQRPLWNDEQCVLNSIIEFKPTSLFTVPLLNDQSFPRLYLWTIQQFSRPFHQNLLSLRFFSLLAMMGAFFVWFKIARQLLGQSWDLILFIASWCASMYLVYYAAELKPYSMDVLASGLIVLFLLNQEQLQKNSKIYYWTLLFLPLLGLWSYPAIFLLLLPLYNLIRDCFDKRLGLLLYLGVYLLMLALVYLIDFRVSVPHLMREMWHDYFISMDSLKGFLSTFGKGMNNLIARRFAEHPRWVKEPSRLFIGLGLGYMLLVVGGQLKKDRFFLRSIIPITFAIFLIQLVLAMGGIYPFAVPRMSLFFTPLLLLMTVMAISAICRYQRVFGILLRCILAGYLIFVSLGVAWDVFLKGNLGAQSTLYSAQD